MRGQRLIFRSGFRVDLEPFEVPAPGPGQVLLRVTRSQVSAGSELNGLRALDGAALRPRVAPVATPPSGASWRWGRGWTASSEGDRVLAFGNHASHVLVDLNDPLGWRSHPDRAPGRRDRRAGLLRRARRRRPARRTPGGAADRRVRGRLRRRGGRAADAAVRAPLRGLPHRWPSTWSPARLELARASWGRRTRWTPRAKDAVAGVFRGPPAGRGRRRSSTARPTPSCCRPPSPRRAPRGTVVLTGSAPGTAEIGLQPELLRRELTIVGSYETGLLDAPPLLAVDAPAQPGACATA